MAGMGMKALIVLVAALAVTTSASAASPDVSAMNLQLADVPGAKLVSQRLVREKGYGAAHLRVFTFPERLRRCFEVGRRAVREAGRGGDIGGHDEQLGGGPVGDV